MKKLILGFLTAMMVLAFMPSNLTAATETGKATLTSATTTISPEAKVLIDRMDEIKAMDVSSLTSVEKKQLRQEMRSIKATLNQMSGGVIYISAGGLLLVIILLVILL